MQFGTNPTIHTILFSQVTAPPSSFNAVDYTNDKATNRLSVQQLAKQQPQTLSGAFQQQQQLLSMASLYGNASTSSALLPSTSSTGQPLVELLSGLKSNPVVDEHVPPHGITPFSQLNFEELLTPTKTFVCPVCHKEMRDKFYLRRHYMIHTGEKPYACPFCAYRGKRKEEVHYHIIRKHAKNCDVR